MLGGRLAGEGEEFTSPSTMQESISDVFDTWVPKKAKQTVPCTIHDKPDIKQVVTIAF